MKGRGDLNRKSTHKMRTNMGMGMAQDSSGSGGGSLGQFLRGLITGKDDKGDKT